jgi:hypothetical protein
VGLERLGRARCGVRAILVLGDLRWLIDTSFPVRCGRDDIVDRFGSVKFCWVGSGVLGLGCEFGYRSDVELRGSARFPGLTTSRTFLNRS